MTNSYGNYSVEIDRIDSTLWEKLLLEFDDASIHQTWSLGANCFGERNLSHLVLRRDGDAIGLAQISIRKLPAISAGVARLFWGPLWRRKGRPTDYTVLDRMIVSLKNEYVTKRRLLLRVWPVGFENIAEETTSVLEKYGFVRHSKDQPYRTLLLEISPSLDELQKNLDPKWRNMLNKAKKNNLIIDKGSSGDMYFTFLKMLREMLLRKKFQPRVSYDLYRKIQSDLPEYLKMKILIATYEKNPVAAGVFSALGETGEYLFGATADMGLKVNGSYLIQWEVLKWLKERKCRWYDLGGIDPIDNPGVYRFKFGLSGKRGKEVTHAGQFYLADNPISHFFSISIDFINYVRSRIRG